MFGSARIVASPHELQVKHPWATERSWKGSDSSALDRLGHYAVSRGSIQPLDGKGSRGIIQVEHKFAFIPWLENHIFPSDTGEAILGL
jgi:hypothetical protein